MCEKTKQIGIFSTEQISFWEIPANCTKCIGIKMSIKTFLLGSAAAMVAVSGAQAADAVVVEPEPVEYVRVCDAYGSGFFFIPGTETCLRSSGYVRTHYSKPEVENETQAAVGEV